MGDTKSYQGYPGPATLGDNAPPPGNFMANSVPPDRVYHVSRSSELSNMAYACSYPGLAANGTLNGAGKQPFWQTLSRDRAGYENTLAGMNGLLKNPDAYGAVFRTMHDGKPIYHFVAAVDNGKDNLKTVIAEAMKSHGAHDSGSQVIAHGRMEDVIRISNATPQGREALQQIGLTQGSQGLTVAVPPPVNTGTEPPRSTPRPFTPPRN